jgi:hypothetical protein
MGEPPSHPALLDWLAIHFAEKQNWQIKKLIKSIVMSATYRQASDLDSSRIILDPGNRWLSRSSRVRLSAEQIRDQVLRVSGLLSAKMHGPSVMPIQPEGIWQVAFSNARWQTSEGEDLYRRAIYTYLKRSAPYPSLVTFDAAGREVCLSQRITTNTPLQALVTLNDPVYFEAAQELAKKILALSGTLDSKMAQAYAMVMGTYPSADKIDVLKFLYQDTKQYFETHKTEALTMVKSTDSDMAAFTIVANSLLNMDEFITRG